MRNGSLKVAWFSPLPPQRCRTALYSAEVLPWLSPHLDIDLFTERPALHEGTTLADRFRILPYEEYGDARLESHYDISVHQMDNDDACRFVYRALLGRPGIIVLHEPTLHEFITRLLADDPTGGGLAYEFNYNYGVGHCQFVERDLPGEAGSADERYPLIQRLLDCSLAVITHDPDVHREVLKRSPGGPVLLLPRPFTEEAVAETYVETVRAVLFEGYHERRQGPHGQAAALRESTVEGVSIALHELGVDSRFAGLLDEVSGAVDSLFPGA